MIDQKDTVVKILNEDIKQKLTKPLEVDGGKVIILRLLHLFNLRNRVELSDIFGLSVGLISTWQTRETVPYELLIRIHLATGVSMQYLLFDEAEPNLNVMKYCKDPDLQPNYAEIKHNLSGFHCSLFNPPHYDGGSQIIERLMSVLKLESKTELSRFFSINRGTLSTWHTRKVTPYELLTRVHLATGISMQYLCFGKHECPVRKPIAQGESPAVYGQSSNATVDMCQLETLTLEHGNKTHNVHYSVSRNFLKGCGIAIDTDLVVKAESSTYFINTEIKTVTKGRYLFAINDSYQIGELRQLPDGNIYLIDGQDKYPFNTDTTKIHGKVVSILQSV